MASINSHCSSNGAHQQHQLDNNAEQTNHVQDAFDNNKLVSAPTEDAQSTATISKVESSTDEPLPFGASHWDKLPRELIDMILVYNTPFVRYVNGLLVMDKKEKGWKEAARSIWLEAFDVDWQGDLSMLPFPSQIDVFLTNEDLCHVKSRFMYHRLCKMYPECTESNQKWIDVDRCIEQIQSHIRPTTLNQKLFRDQPRLRLIHIPMHRMWLDVLEESIQKYPRARASDCIRHNYRKLLHHLIENRIVNLANTRCVDPSYRQSGPINYMVYTCIEFVAMYGHYDLFMKLSKGKNQKMSYHAEHRIAATGNVPIMEYLYNHDNMILNEYRMVTAAEHGHLELVEYSNLHRFEPSPDRMDGAAKNGHFDVVAFLVDYGAYRFTIEAMDDVAANGHLNIVKYLHEHRDEGCTVDAMDIASNNGYLHVVMWLHENRSEGCTEDAMDWAAMNGHLEIVKFLHENRFDGCTEWAMNYAAENGHLDIVKWLHENRTEGCTIDALIGASNNGHLHVVKWLQENKPEICTTDAMDATDARERFEEIDQLHDNFSDEGCEDEAIDGAVSTGYLEFVDWLHQNRPQGCTDDAMSFAVKNLHFEVIKRLHETWPRLCHTHDMIRLAERGHLDFVLSLHKANSQCTVSLFECATRDGHIDVVHGLLETRSVQVSLNAIKYAKTDEIAELLLSQLDADQKQQFKDELERTGYVYGQGPKAIGCISDIYEIKPRQMPEQHGCVCCTIL